MSLPAVAIRNLHKGYRSHAFSRPTAAVVQGLNLTIAPGEAWVLAGPNGAGKTTTLHCLMGLLHPDAGEVALFGRSPLAPLARARVGFQSEIFFSYPSLSAAACLQFYGELSGLAGDALQARIVEVLPAVGLDPADKRRTGTYSKGMMQRLGLAQSLLHNPELLIWDEPTSGLDPLGRRQVFDLLLALKARGKTLLMSTHVLADVERICQHVAILVGGRLRVSGMTATLQAEHNVNSLEELYMATVGQAGQGE